MKRNLILSPAFKEFEQNANHRPREKLRYALSILETVYPVPTKFVKKLAGTDFFELRASVDNEIRVIPFAVDNDNINLATNVILLNGFVKKKHQGLRQGNNKGD